MLETIAAVTTGMAVVAAVLAVGAHPATSGSPAWLTRSIRSWWTAQRSLVRDAGIDALGVTTFVGAQVAAATLGGITALLITGLPVLALPGALAGATLARGAVATRAHTRQAARQDAVLDSVRMLRQLLETGAASVNQAISILAERGPRPLRDEFRAISSKSVGRRRAWKLARDRISEPLFDMLAAAVLIQRPGGGELVPLFADLEASVTAAQEVEREARALQAQARSASNIIVALPIVFLLILSALHSPYLDAFRRAEGEAFLLAMLSTMAGGYVWMRRLLDLPGLQRVRLVDA